MFFELPSKNISFFSPFRRADHPTCLLRKGGRGVWKIHDMELDDSSDIIESLMKLYGINYEQALKLLNEKEGKS